MRQTITNASIENLSNSMGFDLRLGILAAGFSTTTDANRVDITRLHIDGLQSNDYTKADNRSSDYVTTELIRLQS